MSRVEEIKIGLARLQKFIDDEPIITQQFELSLIRVTLADIAVSLAVIADSMSKAESEVEE